MSIFFPRVFSGIPSTSVSVLGNKLSLFTNGSHQPGDAHQIYLDLKLSALALRGREGPG